MYNGTNVFCIALDWRPVANMLQCSFNNLTYVRRPDSRPLGPAMPFSMSKSLSSRNTAPVPPPRSARPRYYLHAPIIGALASQARHDSRPQSLMIRGVLSPGLVGGW
ncbi:DNA repair helicase domain protein [Burkholderia pseudomallei MSHR4299]|nr:DNA repair helicase domain protein [Burkholderia pseudomallei MSHR4299]